MQSFGRSANGLEASALSYTPRGYSRLSARVGPDGLAFSATPHCLTGCAIGEIAGMASGTVAGFSNLGTVVLSVALAFLFGYSLTSLPLLRAGLAGAVALPVNRWLIARGRGHAAVHRTGIHGGPPVRVVAAVALVAAIFGARGAGR